LVIGVVRLLAATLLLWSVTAALLLFDVIGGTSLPRGIVLGALAVIGPGLGDLLYVGGIRLIGLARAFPMAMSASPLFTIALAALLIGESITLTMVLGALLIVGGIVLITDRGGTKSIMAPRASRCAVRSGAVLALAAAALWALSGVALRVAADGVAAPVAASIAMPVAAVFALALAGGSGVTLRPSMYGPRSFIALGAAGLLGPGLGSILYVAAIQSAGAARTAVLSSTAPLFILPLAAVLLGECVTRRMGVGTVLAVAGIWLVAG
jgi:drug/metabolite transporter (DMT)-like permease